jgi:hypothetical protein
MAHYQDYDYVIVNDDLKSATQRLQAIILADRCCLHGLTADTRYSPNWMDGSMSEALALEGKTIVLGVSGSIAAFKAVEVLRRLTKSGANVVTIMTRAACQFVGPLTFQTFSRQPVMLDEEAFRSADPRMKHIWMAETGDLVLIAPTTADIIGKYANGIADDLLSTFLLTTTLR